MNMLIVYFDAKSLIALYKYHPTEEETMTSKYPVLQQMMTGINLIRPAKVKLGVVGVMRKVFQTARGEENFATLLETMGRDPRIELVTAKGFTPDGKGIIWAGQRSVTRATISHFLGQGIDGLMINPCNYGDEMSASQIAGEVHRALRVPIYTYICPDDAVQPDGARILDNECGLFPMRQQMRETMGVNPGYFPFCEIGGPVFGSALDRFVRICSGVRAMSNVIMLQVGGNQPTFPAIEAHSNDFRRRWGFEVETAELIDPYLAIQGWLAGDKPAWFSDLRQELTSAIDFSPAAERIPDLPDKLALMLGWIIETMKATECNTLSIRCWPELFRHLGMMVCSLNGILYSLGIMSPCETDKPGAIASALLHGLGLGDTNDWNFFADLTRWDNGRPLLWHCGPFPAGNVRNCAGCESGCAQAVSGWIFEGINHGGLITGAWGQVGDSVTLIQIRNNVQHQLQLSAWNGNIVDGPATIGTHFYVGMKNPQAAWQFVMTNPFDHHNSGRIGDLMPVLQEGAPWFRLDTTPAFLDNGMAVPSALGEPGYPDGSPC